MLLSKRNSEPLEGQWFIPGGRILKNESCQDCLQRVAQSELGLNIADVCEFRFMGVWDHFYINSAVDQNTSTHYVNLPHYVGFKSRSQITLDDQHGQFEWVNLSVVVKDENLSLTYATVRVGC